MMKCMYTALVAVAAVIAAGCNVKNTSGGPGATNSTDRTGTHLQQADDSFKLSPPLVAPHLKQGEAEVVTISIKRGKNFDQDVAVKFDDLPKGVTIDPATPTIKHGDDKIKVTVKAADEAAVGDFTVKVLGHPQKGPDAASELKLTISKK